MASMKPIALAKANTALALPPTPPSTLHRSPPQIAFSKREHRLPLASFHQNIDSLLKLRTIPIPTQIRRNPPHRQRWIPSLKSSPPLATRVRALPPELLPYVIYDEPTNPLLETISKLPILPLQIAFTSLAAYLAAAWPSRPRGWTRKDLIEVRQSPVQGKGIFAKQNIPENTVLGAYPGRPRSAADMTAKCEAAPLAQFYCFRNRNGCLLDPTDWSGLPSTVPVPGLPWLPVDVTLSYANEPLKTSPGVNVSVEDDPKDNEGLLFVTIEPIAAGMEIFVDYGLDYDRSGYGSGGGDGQES